MKKKAKPFLHLSLGKAGAFTLVGLAHASSWQIHSSVPGDQLPGNRPGNGGVEPVIFFTREAYFLSARHVHVAATRTYFSPLLLPVWLFNHCIASVSNDGDPDHAHAVQTSCRFLIVWPLSSLTLCLPSPA